MSHIDYTFHSTKPPKPDVYTTRRGKSNYLTARYWDGRQWFSVEYSNSRGGKPFSWPKNSITKKPNWANGFFLCSINVGQDSIKWGEPFKVYDDKEVLAYLVSIGELPKDWRTAYQRVMRDAESAKKGGTA